jgi:hypothetical protein
MEGTAYEFTVEQVRGIFTEVGDGLLQNSISEKERTRITTHGKVKLEVQLCPLGVAIKTLGVAEFPGVCHLHWIRYEDEAPVTEENVLPLPPVLARFVALVDRGKPTWRQYTGTMALSLLAKAERDIAAGYGITEYEQ